MKTELIPIPELAQMGVGPRVDPRGVDHGGATRRCSEFFTALKASPTGTLAGPDQWVPSFEEYTDFVGLKEYRELENEFLPQGADRTEVRQGAMPASRA